LVIKPFDKNKNTFLLPPYFVALFKQFLSLETDQVFFSYFIFKIISFDLLLKR